MVSRFRKSSSLSTSGEMRTELERDRTSRRSDASVTCLPARPGEGGGGCSRHRHDEHPGEGDDQAHSVGEPGEPPEEAGSVGEPDSTQHQDRPEPGEESFAGRDEARSVLLHGPPGEYCFYSGICYRSQFSLNMW